MDSTSYEASKVRESESQGTTREVRGTVQRCIENGPSADSAQEQGAAGLGLLVVAVVIVGTPLVLLVGGMNKWVGLALCCAIGFGLAFILPMEDTKSGGGGA